MKSASPWMQCSVTISVSLTGVPVASSVIVTTLFPVQMTSVWKLPGITHARTAVAWGPTKVRHKKRISKGRVQKDMQPVRPAKNERTDGRMSQGRKIEMEGRLRMCFEIFKFRQDKVVAVFAVVTNRRLSSISFIGFV